MFVPSYSASATREAGAVVALVEERKVAKYICTPHPSAFLLPSCSGNDWDFQFTHQGTPQGPRSTQATKGGSSNCPSHAETLGGRAVGQLYLGDGPFLLT